MQVTIVTPELPEARAGNWITAERYRGILGGLGHRVDLTTIWDEAPCDVMIALHARRSHPSIRRFRDKFPDKPLIVVLTGTDLYRDIRHDLDAQESLELANRLVVLQRMGLPELPERYHGKTRVIYQSVSSCSGGDSRVPSTYFKVVVVGHLRAEKDPMRTALAARLLPPQSRLRVVHVGSALDDALGEQARQETETNPRYRWVGGVPHWRVCRLIAGSHVLSQTSLMEGSCNAVCEALMLGTPVIASRISGLMGTLGDDYPGYFTVENQAELAEALWCAESDAAYYAELGDRCAEASHLLTPERESQAWSDLLGEFE